MVFTYTSGDDACPRRLSVPGGRVAQAGGQARARPSWAKCGGGRPRVSVSAGEGRARAVTPSAAGVTSSENNLFLFWCRHASTSSVVSAFGVDVKPAAGALSGIQRRCCAVRWRLRMTTGGCVNGARAFPSRDNDNGAHCSGSGFDGVRHSVHERLMNILSGELWRASASAGDMRVDGGRTRAGGLGLKRRRRLRAACGPAADLRSRRFCCLRFYGGLLAELCAASVLVAHHRTVDAV